MRPPVLGCWSDSHTLVALRLALQHLNPRSERLLETLNERLELCIDACCCHVATGTELTSVQNRSDEVMRTQSPHLEGDTQVSQETIPDGKMYQLRQCFWKVIYTQHAVGV